MSAFTVPMKEWGGAAGRTLIQGLHIHTPSGTMIVHQADDVAGQAEQNIVFRAHKPDGDYIGAITVKRAGHGSSVGLESLDADSMRFWFGHDQLNCIGYVTYTVGQTGVATFTKVPGVPRGDISIDQDADVLCLRTGNRYRGYTLTSVKTGKPKNLWDFTIPSWGRRFQGHLFWRGLLFVHRDVESNGSSRAHVFDTKGKQINALDTSKLGDEAEGFVAIADQVYVVKRTGGNNSGRVVEVTPWLVIEDPKGDDVIRYVLWRGVRVNPECVPSLDKLAEITGPDIRVTPTQGGFNRGGVVASAGTHDGGAAMDLSVNGMTSAQITTTVRLARECGWAAWYRPYLKNVWPRHIHMIRVGDLTASIGAKAQVTDYRNGRNGLAGHGKDTGPSVRGANGEKFPTWAQSKWNPANKPKTLADYITELGQVKDVSAAAINKARGSGNASRHVAQMQAWLNLAIPTDPLVVDGIWSAAGPTQAKLDAFRRSLGWTGKDTEGEVGPHSLTLLHDCPAVAASNPVPVREQYVTK